jgi:hypothetical protein
MASIGLLENLVLTKSLSSPFTKGGAFKVPLLKGGFRGIFPSLDRVLML